MKGSWANDWERWSGAGYLKLIALTTRHTTLQGAKEHLKPTLPLRPGPANKQNGMVLQMSGSMIHSVPTAQYMRFLLARTRLGPASLQGG